MELWAKVLLAQDQEVEAAEEPCSVATFSSVSCPYFSLCLRVPTDAFRDAHVLTGRFGMCQVADLSSELELFAFLPGPHCLNGAIFG